MEDKDYSCPSAPASNPENKVFGVVLGDVETPRVGYLAKGIDLPDREKLVDRGIDPGHAFRFTGKCANTGCGQFKNGGCRLGKDIVKMLEPVVDVAPACTIRSTCRWFAENGVEACLRCPQVTTRVMPKSADLYEVANMVPQPGRGTHGGNQQQPTGPSA
nr:hypothetical protein [uncultured Sphingomonas sp.]